MIGKTLNEIKIGDQAEFAKTISEFDIYMFAGITGDFNPVHINEDYAKQTFFKTRIAHGIMTAGFISTLLGTQLPGPGSIYIKQDLKFLAPVKIGDTITARVEVVEILDKKIWVRLKTTCFNQDDTQVLDGEAIISPPRPPKK
ncbi:MAG: MaoC family dehydratase [Desulfobacterales bacterium]|nr:MAG: MaoC family dehydratase [Desulfobacterales bacterium]